MHFASKIIGLVCVILAVVMWAVTLTIDPTPQSIGAAASLTAILVVGGVLAVYS